MINNFWLAQDRRKEPRLPVYAVMHLAGSLQPIGWIQGWSVSQRGAKSMFTRCGEDAKVELVKILPPECSGEAAS